MKGKVTQFYQGFYTIETANQIYYLREWQMGGAHVGDTVEITYQTTATSGLWNVTKILSKGKTS